MSSPSGDPFDNPYNSPRASSRGYARGGASIPVFCTTMFAIDLVFLAIRAALAAFGGLGLMGGAIPKNHPMYPSATYEVLCGALMVVVGVPADLGFLFRKSWAVVIGYASVLPTLGSIAVGLWQVAIILDSFPANSPQRAGAMIGGGVMVVIRLAIVVAYVAAIMAFSNWQRQQPRPAESDRF